MSNEENDDMATKTPEEPTPEQPTPEQPDQPQPEGDQPLTPAEDLERKIKRAEDEASAGPNS